MTDITASAFVNELGAGVIHLHNQAGWNTTAWSIKYVDTSLPGPPNILLYETATSGNGYLTMGGKMLVVIIPYCPLYEFQLKIGNFATESLNFTKTFNLMENNEDILNWLVPVGAVRTGVSAGTGTLRAGPNLILFMSEMKPAVGGQKAISIYEGNSVVGLALGCAFRQVRSTLSTNLIHPRPGYVFTKFIWFKKLPTSTPEEYLFLVRNIQYRSRTGVTTEEYLEITTNTFTADRPPLYNVQPTDVFVLDGVLP